VRPQPAHPREVVLELRELDLELASALCALLGEDVENRRGAVDHRDLLQRLLEVALPGAGSARRPTATTFASSLATSALSSSTLRGRGRSSDAAPRGADELADDGDPAVRSSSLSSAMSSPSGMTPTQIARWAALGSCTSFRV